MKSSPISELELKAIVNSEIRSAMGEITGELANERALAMDYYYGEPIGKLVQPNADRSSVVITTLRDTVEWLMPQLMRMFAQADKVCEFEPVGPEDEEAAKQETQAINFIFWRQNEGFLLLYTWFKDALLQKNGTVKYWIDEDEEREREEYDGLTEMGLAQFANNKDYQIVEAEPSETQSIDGSPLYHIVVEKVGKTKRICVESIPPEEFLISDDATSLDVQTHRPRFCGHYTEKSRSELKGMGFSESDINEMMKSIDTAQYDQETISRYNLSDESQLWTGGTEYGHESQKKAKLVEGYLELDMDGDGYAELIKVYAAGNFIEYEECDDIPFACLTPYINPHKHFGQSEYDMTHDIQEIGTDTMRNILDNMKQTNNMRVVANENVDLDSLLVSRPGAPVYTETTGPVSNDIMSLAPPAMWKDGLEMMEYLDVIRKDRTGISDQTMGLSPSQIANANTGVIADMLESSHSKIELVARIFAETGLKWLFRGLHKLCRKSYDQELRYELSGKYVQVNPQEWKKRTDITVNVGTATGSQQRELNRLTQIGQVQAAMIQNGGLGITILPMHIYQTAKELAECLGAKDGNKYFLDPLWQLKTPQMAQIIQAQLPPPQPDQQTELLKLNAQIEGQKNQLAHEAKQNELMLKREQMQLDARIESFKTQLEMMSANTKNQTEIEKARTDAFVKMTTNKLKEMELLLDDNKSHLDRSMEQYKAELSSWTDLELKGLDIESQPKEPGDNMKPEERVSYLRQQADQIEQALEKQRQQAEDQHNKEMARMQMEQENMQIQRTLLQEQANMKDQYAKTALQLNDLLDRMEEMKATMKKPRTITRDSEGRPTAIGDRQISYNPDGTMKQIG